MPTTRTRRTRRLTTLTLDQLSYTDLYELVHGGRRPIYAGDHSRWRTWAKFFDEYALVRTEVLDRLEEGDDSLLVRLASGEVPFAERIRDEVAAAGPGAVYETHRHGGYCHSHIYAFGDAHVHEEWRQNPPLRLPGGGLWHGVIWPATEVREESIWPR